MADIPKNQPINARAIDYFNDILLRDPEQYDFIHDYVSGMIEDNVKKGYWTRDMMQLNKHVNHYLFVYNEFKMCYDLSQVLEKAGLYLGNACTTHYWNMYIRTSDTGKREPFTCKYGGFQKSGKVRGELWLVQPSLLRLLDEFHCNGVLFNRTKTMVKLSHASAVKNIDWKMAVHAWWYQGREKILKDSIDAKLFKQVEPMHSIWSGKDEKHLIYTKGIV